MSKSIVFDIETYRPNWKIWRSRRETLDPERNSIITVGIFDGKETSISPVIEDLKKERESVEFFLKKLKETQASTLVGYNILHFDIPYLIYKADAIGKELDLSRFELLDLYWILPYWLHNIPSGKAFFKRFPSLGNLWRFSNVVEYILKKEPNPVSNLDVLRLWEMKRFDDIEKHLELDLVHTFLFLESPVIQETLDHIQRQYFEKNNCEDFCSFRRLLLKTPDKASYYCTLSQELTSKERRCLAIDVIDSPLPRRGISWIPPCINKNRANITK